MNTVRGPATRTGQVPDLGRPLTVRRDTFKDILADVEVQTTPQRWVRFPHVATSTPILRPAEHHVERTPHIGASWVLLYSQGLFDNPKPHKDLYEEGFSHSLQVAVMEFCKLKEPKVAKLKEGYSSNASLAFQLWLKDIWVYALECHLS